MPESKYPRIMEVNKHRNQGMCEICRDANKAGRVYVQVSWFRGEDGVHKVCPECIDQHSKDQLLKNLGYIRNDNAKTN